MSSGWLQCKQWSSRRTLSKQNATKTLSKFYTRSQRIPGKNYPASKQTALQSDRKIVNIQKMRKTIHKRIRSAAKFSYDEIPALSSNFSAAAFRCFGQSAFRCREKNKSNFSKRFYTEKCSQKTPYYEGHFLGYPIDYDSDAVYKTWQLDMLVRKNPLTRKNCHLRP